MEIITKKQKKKKKKKNRIVRREPTPPPKPTEEELEQALRPPLDGSSDYEIEKSESSEDEDGPPRTNGAFVDRFQQDIERRQYRIQLREKEAARSVKEKDPEATFQPDLTLTKNTNRRRLRQSNRRTFQAQNQRVVKKSGRRRKVNWEDEQDGSSNSNSNSSNSNRMSSKHDAKASNVEKGTWGDEFGNEYGNNEYGNDGYSERYNGKRRLRRRMNSNAQPRGGGSKKNNVQDNNPATLQSRNGKYSSRSNVVDSGYNDYNGYNDEDEVGSTNKVVAYNDDNSSGIVDDDFSYYDSKEDFYSQDQEDTFSDQDDEEQRKIEDEELAALKRHDSFERRLDSIFERTIDRRHRREVQRKRQLKQQREAIDKDAARAAGVGAKDMQEYLSSRSSRSKPTRSRRERQSRNNHVHTTNTSNRRRGGYHQRNPMNHLTRDGMEEIGIGQVHSGMLGAGVLNPMEASLVQEANQLRMEKLVRSGQRRTEMMQQQNFDFLRSEFEKNLANVSSKLAVMEARETKRLVHQDAVDSTSKWWSEEELEMMNGGGLSSSTFSPGGRRRREPRQPQRRITRTSNVNDNPNGGNYYKDNNEQNDPTIHVSPRLAHARSKLHHLKAKDPKAYRVRMNKQKQIMEMKLATGRKDRYGTGKATLTVLNDDKRRMKKGKQWKTDLDRPRVKDQKIVL